MKVKYLSFYTLYKYKINSMKKFYIEDYVCFSKIYRELKRLNNNGTIYVYINQDEGLNEMSIDNYTILTNGEINKYLSWLKDVTGFKLRKTKQLIQAKGNRGFCVKIDFKDKSSFEVKFILALVRNMYEHPFNIQLKTVFGMKKIKEFKNLDLSQRICIVNNSMSWVSGHSSYSNYSKAIDNNQFKERYLAVKNSINNVHSFYEDHIRIKKIIGIDSIYENIDCLKNGTIPDKLKNILIENYNIMK